MVLARTFKGVSGLFELILGLPLLGGMVVMGSGWGITAVMFVLHTVTLLLSLQHRQSFYGSAAGIVTCLLVSVPIAGMFGHWVTAVLLLVSMVDRYGAGMSGYNRV
ncbi:hypothetical protein [Saccharibacillus kuerlensis]|uniref:Uncharacterized protein n=1 Tax=Saccharibacillus kuerlensis TaxID=459527 RepID=A0ABQ2L717_9BACL|nr:hypothetical protein [Saccharibacillus kuerlensis]GGO02581.1 hypothetical protein GCM10010969_26050 [Saccharibacillus kuerlensis]